ncbi:MAG: class B sortase [Oscillospiraceae bacterium]|nr:class B sortase [Oscillospiraceae bacterium]
MPSYLNDDDNENNKQEKKKLNASRTIAMDKLEIREERHSANRHPKKSDKIAGRPKSGFARFASAAFPQAGDAPGEKFRKIFLIAAVLVLIVALVILGLQILGIQKGNELNEKIREIAGVQQGSLITGSYSRPDYIENPAPDTATAPGTEEIPSWFNNLTPVTNTPLNINFAPLIEMNPDTRAWVKITDTLINNVVVQSYDNHYYVTHDFNKKDSESGTIFSSYQNRWDGKDENIILFGHNMQNGEFFSYLVHYYPDDGSRDPLYFYKVHPTIMVATPNGGSETYKIFAGMLVNTESKHGEPFQYINKTSFRDVDDFNNFIIDVMDRSRFFTDVDIKYGDQLLTLSTCHWPYGRSVDTRWVILARKVRPGESEYVDTSKAYRNYQARMFDYVYKMYPELTPWTGSVWDKSKLLSY